MNRVMSKDLIHCEYMGDKNVTVQLHQAYDIYIDGERRRAYHCAIENHEFGPQM